VNFKAADGEIRQDMQAVVNSLKTYVTSAREMTNENNEQLSSLVRERVGMAQRIAELEEQSEVVKNQAAEIVYLREVPSLFISTHNNMHGSEYLPDICH